MITVLSGKNNYLLSSYKNDMVNDHIKKYGEYSVEVLNALERSAKDIIISAQTMPFLVTSKLVLITDVALSKEFTESLDEVLSIDHEDINIAIVEPNFDKRSAIYKTLKKKTDFKEFNELDEHSLATWLSDLAKSNSYQISNSEILYLIQRVGNNQQKLYNQLIKLVSYNNKVTRENIDLLTQKSIKSTTFDMLDSLFRGDIVRAIEIYNEQRSLNVEPQLIIGSLVWQLRVILAAKYSKEGIDQTSKMSKFSPYSLKKSQPLASKLSKEQLKSIVNSVLILDIDSKSKSIDIDQAIKHRLLMIADQVS